MEQNTPAVQIAVLSTKLDAMRDEYKAGIESIKLLLSEKHDRLEEIVHDNRKNADERFAAADRRMETLSQRSDDRLESVTGRMDEQDKRINAVETAHVKIIAWGAGAAGVVSTVITIAIPFLAEIFKRAMGG